jgi:hypothetical protein
MPEAGAAAQPVPAVPGRADKSTGSWSTGPDRDGLDDPGHGIADGDLAVAEFSVDDVRVLDSVCA